MTDDIRKETGKRELRWFMIGDSYGGSQDWMEDEWMNKGGCGALTACDTCIYLAGESQGEGLYPFDSQKLTKEQYIRFGMMMKPYLSPRYTGINKLEIFIDGFREYLRDMGREKELLMEPFHGDRPLAEAAKVVEGQIDKGLPVPCLVLYHKNPALEDYVWHWFLLTGYKKSEAGMDVKAVTYGAYQWISLEELWDTGYEEKGGLVIYSKKGWRKD